MIDNCCNMFSAALDGFYGWQDELLAILAFVVVFNFLARWILRVLQRRFEKQKKVWGASLVQALYAPLVFYTWFFAIAHASNLILPQIVSEDYYRSMHKVLAVVAVLSFAWFILRWKKLLLRVVRSKIKHHEMHVKQAKVDVIDKIATIITIFITILLLLEVTDRSVSTLIAFGGVGGLAIAFASQEMIANYFSGFMIYTTRPFVVGDWIQLPERNIEGYVEEIGWYMTRIRTFEKRPIYVPNALFSKMVVVTPSRMSHRKFKEIIALRYCDLPKARKFTADVEAMFENHPQIDQDQKILTCLHSLSSSSIEFELSAYTKIVNSEDFALFKQEILFSIIDIIKKNGAELASPVTEINVANGLVIKQEI